MTHRPNFVKPGKAAASLSAVVKCFAREVLCAKFCKGSDAAMGDGQPQLGDARLEIVLETGKRARQDIGIAGADAAASWRAIARDGA